ncbi:MAG: hypothetical protein ACO4AJ_05945, partial [Prochlorothrix sp.]
HKPDFAVGTAVKICINRGALYWVYSPVSFGSISHFQKCFERCVTGPDRYAAFLCLGPVGWFGASWMP